jgi:hypothetical protein
MWQDIETAPKDGTWVLLRGGMVNRGDAGDYRQQPAVVAHWVVQTEDELPNYPDANFWAVAFWDGDWYTDCKDPTHWMQIP